jgi:hypothetical protein
MDHISGNKFPIGSMEISFDREYPYEVSGKVFVDGLQTEKMPKIGPDR